MENCRHILWILLPAAGTIMGVSRYLKGKNPDVQIIGLQPADGASIAGIRRWPKAYLPRIFEVPWPA